MLILALPIAFCLSIPGFASLVCVPFGIMTSQVGMNICSITAGIKKYKSIINKNKKKRDKLVLLEKVNLNAIEVLDSKALIDWCINHDEFVSANNVLWKYNGMKEGIKDPETSVEYII